MEISVSAMFSQLPCFGVKCTMKRAHTARPSVSPSVRMQAASLWLLRLSRTRWIRLSAVSLAAGQMLTLPRRWNSDKQDTQPDKQLHALERGSSCR